MPERDDMRCPICGGVNGGHVRDHAVAPREIETTETEEEDWVYDGWK